MTDGWRADRAVLNRAVDELDCKAVIVIVVNDDDTMSTLAKGMDLQGMMLVTFDAARQFADELYANMSPAQRRGLVIALPTRDDAKRLGLIRERGNGQR